MLTEVFGDLSRRAVASLLACTIVGSLLLAFGGGVGGFLGLLLVVLTAPTIILAAFVAVKQQEWPSLPPIFTSGTFRYTIFVLITLAIAGALSGMYWRDWTDSDAAPTVEFVRNMVLIVGGALALPLAIWRGYVAEQQVKAAQESVAAQRFQAAAQMLGHDLNAVRLGAVHTLTDLGRQDPAVFHVDTARVLAAFVRHPHNQESAVIEEISLPLGRMVREDVYTALTALVTRGSQAIRAERRQEYRINLEGQDFRGMDVAGWNLSRLDLRGANFCGVDLRSMNFSESDLSRCTFTSAKIQDANMKNTRLSGTNFTAWSIEEDGTYGGKLDGPNVYPVSGLTQEQLDSAVEDQNDPPKLRGVRGSWGPSDLSWHGRRADQL